MMLFLIISITNFLLPIFIGIARRHKNIIPISLTLLLLGWTLIGYIVALITSFSSNVDANKKPMLSNFYLLLIVFLLFALQFVLFGAVLFKYEAFLQ